MSGNIELITDSGGGGTTTCRISERNEAQIRILVAPPVCPLPSSRPHRLSHLTSSSTTQCPRIRTIRLLQPLPRPSRASLKTQYKKRTKRDIAAHSLAAEIKSCDSPKAVLTVLETQVQKFDPSPSANETWKRLLDPTITVLYAFSGFVSTVAGPVNRETSTRLRPTL